MNSSEASDLNQSVVEELLPYKLESSGRRPISGEVWCFFDTTHLPLEQFLGCMVTVEMTRM